MYAAIIIAKLPTTDVGEMIRLLLNRGSIMDKDFGKLLKAVAKGKKAPKILPQR